MIDNIPNIPLTGHLLSQTTDGYIASAKYIDGTYLVVKTIEERNALTDTSIYVDKVLAVGTPVFVSDDNITYRWNGNEWLEETVDFSSIQDKIDAVESKANSNEESIVSVNEAITEINVAAQLLETKVDGIQTNVTTITNDLSTMNTTLEDKVDNSTLEAAKTSLSNDIDQVRSDAADADADIRTELSSKADITYVNESLEDKVDTQDFTEYQSGIRTELNNIDVNKVNVTTFTTDITNVNNRLNSLSDAKLDKSAYNTDKEKLATKVEVTNQINQLKADLDTNGYATDAELNAISTSLTQQLANKASNTDLSNTNNKITELTNTVNSNKTAAENAHTTLENRINANESHIAENLAQINANFTNIQTVQSTLQAHNTEYEGKVDTNISEIQSIKNNINQLDSDKLDVSTYNSDKQTFALKTEIPSTTNLATKSEVTAVDNKVTDLNSTVSDLKNTVNNKADKTTVSNQLGAKVDKTTLENNYTNNTQLNNLLKNKVDNILYANYAPVINTVGNLTAGTDISGWSIHQILTKMFGLELVSISFVGDNTMLNKAGTTITLRVNADPEGFDLSNLSWEVTPTTGITFADNQGDEITLRLTSDVAANTVYTVKASILNKEVSKTITCIAQLTVSEQIIKNQQSMYITDVDGTLKKVPWSVIAINANIGASDEYTKVDATTSGFYQVKAADGSIIQEGYQSILPVYQEGPLTVALPSSLTLNDITLYVYDSASSKSWVQIDTNFLQEASNQTISGYTVYEDPNNASQGEHFRFAINN